jgi:hypothetical protein
LKNNSPNLGQRLFLKHSSNLGQRVYMILVLLEVASFEAQVYHLKIACNF